MLFFKTEVPINISLSGPMQGAMVGSSQVIRCSANLDDNILMISWTEPGGGSITTDDRVIISPTTSSGNNYTSSLQFTYLMEGDEGNYTCNVILPDGNNVSQSFEIDSLTGKTILF